MKRVLYVEDSEDTAAAVKIILMKEGIEADIAPNGKDGVKKAQNGKYDLFLLDIMLPDMSGWDVFEKIKGIQGARYAFLSAVPISTERMTELKKAGVSDYITKPFDRPDLVKRVKVMLK